MTQVRDRLPLRLTLTQLQLPQTAPQPTRGNASQTAIASRLSGRGDGPSRLPQLPEASPPEQRWTIHPGEPGEILLRLENTTADFMELAVSVDGDFPADWCAVATEGSVLAAGDRMEVLLYFRTAADLCERDGEIPLDYTGQVRVEYRLLPEPPATPTPTEEAVFPQFQAIDFHLHLRPRSLYLDYLPEIYREVDFIGRLLHIFERAFEPDVGILEAMWAYLDPALAPESMLAFLSHWVGWQSASGLSLARQRVLIKRAIELHRCRGTRRGLRQYIHLYTGLSLDANTPSGRQQIAIEEDLEAHLRLGQARLGQSAFLGGKRLFHFRVILRPPPNLELDESLIREIVEQAKPAACTYDLIIEPDPVPGPPTTNPRPQLP